mgnify:CR=1 FL=1|tara:strand:- start:3973 stop:4641 length:669 start_codon:yes stop_codon:yes gene_type:complete
MGVPTPQSPSLNAEEPSERLNLQGLPTEILEAILLNLNPDSLSSAAKTSKLFAFLVAGDSFQRAYTSLTPGEYNDILQGSIPDIFGQALGKQIQTLLEGVPQYAYGNLFRNLISEKNMNLLKGSNGALATELSEKFLNKNDKGIVLPHNLAKFLAITAKASAFFTAGMEGDDRGWIIKALAPLSPEKIKAIAQQTGKLFTAGMTEYVRAMIIEALAQEFLKG